MSYYKYVQNTYKNPEQNNAFYLWQKLKTWLKTLFGWIKNSQFSLIQKGNLIDKDVAMI